MATRKYSRAKHNNARKKMCHNEPNSSVHRGLTERHASALPVPGTCPHVPGREGVTPRWRAKTVNSNPIGGNTMSRNGMCMCLRRRQPERSRRLHTPPPGSLRRQESIHDGRRSAVGNPFPTAHKSGSTYPGGKHIMNAKNYTQ
jgi:hypothetical protein